LIFDAQRRAVTRTFGNAVDDGSAGAAGLSRLVQIAAGVQMVVVMKI
jgi:hypothetical protein